MMKRELLMKNFRNQHMRYICLMMALLFILGMKAQEADNEFRLDAQLVTRGELRQLCSTPPGKTRKDERRNSCFFLSPKYQIQVVFVIRSKAFISCPQ